MTPEITTKNIINIMSLSYNGCFVILLSNCKYYFIAIWYNGPTNYQLSLNSCSSLYSYGRF